MGLLPKLFGLWISKVQGPKEVTTLVSSFPEY